MAKSIDLTCDGIHTEKGYIYNVSSEIPFSLLKKCENRWYEENGMCIAYWSPSDQKKNSSVIDVQPRYLLTKECLNGLQHVLTCDKLEKKFEHRYNVSQISTPSPLGTSIFTNSTSSPPGTSNNSLWFLLFLLLLIPIAAGMFLWLKKRRYLQTVCWRPDGRRENRNGVHTNQSNHQPSGETPQHRNPQPNGIAPQHPNPQHNGIAPQQSDPQPNGTTPLLKNNTAAIPKPDERTNNSKAADVKITMSDLLQNEEAPLLDTHAATNRDPDDVEMNGNVNRKINPSDNQHKEETQVLNNQAAEGEE